MAYPTSLDELTDGVPSDVDAPSTAMNDATYPHDDHHRALAVAVEAVEAELGTDPSGSEATVKARIAATETVANAAAVKASNLSDLTSAATARTNLGLGGAATLSVGTTAGTVAAGDDSRITGAVPKSTVTTAGDLIYGTGNAAVSRLGLGSAGQVLTAGASAPTWAAAPGTALSVPLATYFGGTQLVGVPGERFINFTAQSYSSNTDRYTAFSVQKAITVSDVLFSVSTGPASDATMYVAIYNATNGWQPTGSPVWSSSTAVATSFTGTKTFSSLGLALPAGNYVTAMNPSVTMSLAIGYSGAPAVVASNFQAPFCYQVVRTAAAFTSSPSEWSNLGMNVAQWHVLMMKWT